MQNLLALWNSMIAKFKNQSKLTAPKTFSSPAAEYVLSEFPELRDSVARAKKSGKVYSFADIKPHKPVNIGTPEQIREYFFGKSK